MTMRKRSRVFWTIVPWTSCTNCPMEIQLSSTSRGLSVLRPFSSLNFSVTAFNLDIDTLGMHEIVFHSIMKCDPDCIKELSSNIVLTGGNSSFPGTLERLAKEVI